MPTVRKSVIVPHRAAAMFDLVDDVERYPEFLPWCAGTELLERTENPDVRFMHCLPSYHDLTGAGMDRVAKHVTAAMERRQ